MSTSSNQSVTFPNKSTYNLIRVLAMMMVLAVHTLGTTSQFAEPYNTTWYVNATLTSLFMICNPIFFMLSGKFNLNKSFDSLHDYISFYYKKLINTVIPFIAFSLVFYLAQHSFQNVSMIGFIKNFMVGNIVGVYWFMYSLICIFVFSPFYSKMLTNMSKLDKKIFFAVLIIINTLVTLYLLTENNTWFSYGSFAIIRWHLFYFIGYLIEDVIDTRKSQNTFILLGIVAFVFHFFQKRFFISTLVVTHDPNTWTILEAIAFYLILLRIPIKSKILQKILTQLSEISFIFYLIHMYILDTVASYFPRNISTYHNALFSIIIYILSFSVCFATSYLINRLILKPFTTFALKLIKK